MRVIKAFGRQDFAEENLAEVSHAGQLSASLKARRVKALLSPIVSVAVAAVHGGGLVARSALILAGAMTVGSSDIPPGDLTSSSASST